MNTVMILNVQTGSTSTLNKTMTEHCSISRDMHQYHVAFLQNFNSILAEDELEQDDALIFSV